MQAHPQASYFRLTINNYSIIHNKKVVLLQRWPQVHSVPYWWMPWKFTRLTDYANVATFPKIIHGLLFRSTLWTCVQNLKSIALPIPEIIGGSQKILGSPWLWPHSYFPKNLIGLPYRLFLYVHSFSAIFDWSFGWRVANLQSKGRGHRESGMVPPERWVPIDPP